MTQYGYIRVSTQQQNTARQVEALLRAGISKKHLFVDRCSGRDFNRPAYRKLLKKLRPGDAVYILSLDRLGRTYKEIQQEWRRIIQEKKADIIILDMPLLNTRSAKSLLDLFVHDLVRYILSFAAQLERENTRTRQTQGIAAAKKRGVRFGRPPVPLPEDFIQTCESVEQGTMNYSQAARHCRLPRSTFCRKYKNWQKQKET